MEDGNLEMNTNELSSEKERLKDKPEDCWYCKSSQVKYWDETDEEIVFKCHKCGKFMAIPFDKSVLHWYFA